MCASASMCMVCKCFHVDVLMVRMRIEKRDESVRLTASNGP